MAVCHFLRNCLSGRGQPAPSGRAWARRANGARLRPRCSSDRHGARSWSCVSSVPDLGCRLLPATVAQPPRACVRCWRALAAAARPWPVSRGGELTLPPAGPAAALDLGILWPSSHLLVASVSPRSARCWPGSVLCPSLVSGARPAAAGTHAALHRSRRLACRPRAPPGRRAALADMWRELCWWYVVTPGRDECDIVLRGRGVGTDRPSHSVRRGPADLALDSPDVGSRPGRRQPRGPGPFSGFLRLSRIDRIAGILRR